MDDIAIFPSGRSTCALSLAPWPSRWSAAPKSTRIRQDAGRDSADLERPASVDEAVEPRSDHASTALHGDGLRQPPDVARFGFS